MKNALTFASRCLSFKSPVTFTLRRMWWKATVNTYAARINSLSRSRKLILLMLLMLGVMYYLIPSLFGLRHRSATIVSSTCMVDKLRHFQTSIDNFDAIFSHVPPVGTETIYPAYVGNGHVAAAYDSDNGLFIRLNRALAVPVKFYPVIQSSMDDSAKEEIVLLDIKRGTAYRLQTFMLSGGCVSIKSQLYAHRSRPSVLVQDLHIDNPTGREVTVSLDQVKASGWTDSTMTSGSVKNYKGEVVPYTITAGLAKLKDSSLEVAVSVATVTISNTHSVGPREKVKSHIVTVTHYTKAGEHDEVTSQMPDLQQRTKKDIEDVFAIDPEVLRKQHTDIWEKLWESGVSISYSMAAGAINGDKINTTFYYVLSNSLAPLHDPLISQEERNSLMRTLHYPDKCYKDHTSLHSTTLWVDPVDEDSIARIVATWIITLEKQGCSQMIKAGIEGVLQAMMLSIGSLAFGNDHLEMKLEPKDLHRDFLFHRLNYGNNTHLNISIKVGEDNKANLFVAVDRNDKPYYGCDAGCLDPPVPLSKALQQFPVKLTEPLTAILYITADKVHMEEYKHAIHVREIVEAPAHEHHVIALHKHGHHFGGLPTIFWISIAFLIIVFHLFLFKLIYNEYCQAQERFTRTRYNL